MIRMTRLFATTALCTASLFGQSVATLDIGGPGTIGLQNSQDPPTLGDGTDARARLTFTYDSATTTLDVTVENTTANVAGLDSPLLTRIYFNCPDGLMTGLVLTGQTAASGATPDWSAMGSANVGAFGDFDHAFGVNNLHGGVAPAGATQWGGPPNAAVMGPLILSFDVLGAAPNLDAQAFAAAPSDGPRQVNAAAKFQSGNFGGSGSIGTRTGCVPGVWMAGTPCIGNTITFYASNGVGCHNCLTLSYNPGPFTLPGGVVVPGAPPYQVLWSVDALDTVTPVSITIPFDPNLIGLQIVLINVVNDPAHGVVISSPLDFTICS